MGRSGVGFVLLHSLPHLRWSNIPPQHTPMRGVESNVTQNPLRKCQDLWALTQSGRQSSQKDGEGEEPCPTTQREQLWGDLGWMERRETRSVNGRKWNQLGGLLVCRDPGPRKGFSGTRVKGQRRGPIFSRPSLVQDAESWENVQLGLAEGWSVYTPVNPTEGQSVQPCPVPPLSLGLLAPSSSAVTTVTTVECSLSSSRCWARALHASAPVGLLESSPGDSTTTAVSSRRYWRIVPEVACESW